MDADQAGPSPLLFPKSGDPSWMPRIRDASALLRGTALPMASPPLLTMVGAPSSSRSFSLGTHGRSLLGRVPLEQALLVGAFPPMAVTPPIGRHSSPNAGAWELCPLCQKNAELKHTSLLPSMSVSGSSPHGASHLCFFPWCGPPCSAMAAP
jgi:hypothetical protein